MTPLVVDGLGYIGPSLFGSDQSKEALLARMEATGVDVTAVAVNRPPDYDLASANAWLAEAVATSDDHLVGLARVDANHRGAAEHAERGLSTLGLHGLLLHPREEVFRIDDSRVDVVVDVAGAHDRPVVVSAGWPWVAEALQVAELAARHPDVRFVMTNGGQFNISGLGQFDAELALRRCPNLAMFTNGVYRQDFIERVIVEFGADRVLFAAASPQFEAAYELLRVQKADVANEDQRARVLGRNACDLYGLA